MAIRISNTKNKRVSIGYLYSIPDNQRTDHNACTKVTIASYK